MSIDCVPTICPYCSCGCGINLIVRDGRIIGQEPWKEHPINEGANCPKGKNAYEFLYSEDRLKMPLVRKNGTLKEAYWDEALDLVASKFKEAIPETFGALGSGKTSNEESYILQKFVRVVMGTNTIEYVGRLCHSSAVAALVPAVGSGVMQTSQPDVLIEMDSFDEQRWLVLIEAKYLSGKSSHPDDGDHPNDQLAREMHNLRIMARRMKIHQYALVYVTAHTLIPRLDIEEAVSELATKTGDGASNRFYWTTWRRLATIVSEASDGCKGPIAAILKDLETIVRRMGLTFFEGVSFRGWKLGPTPWVFRGPKLHIVFEWVPMIIGHYVFEESLATFSWALHKRPDRTSWRWLS